MSGGYSILGNGWIAWTVIILFFILVLAVIFFTGWGALILLKWLLTLI